MPTTYPSTKQTFTNPAGTSLLTSPDHASAHTTENDTIAALEDTVGTTAGTNLMRNAASGDFVITATAGGTFQQALGNLKLTGGTLSPGTYTTVNSIPGSALATNAITLGTAVSTANFQTNSGTQIQVTNLTSTVTIPSGGRMVKITAQLPLLALTTALTAIVAVGIWDGAVGVGTNIAYNDVSISSAGAVVSAVVVGLITPAAGAKTYNVAVATNAGTLNTNASSDTHAQSLLLVELV